MAPHAVEAGRLVDGDERAREVLLRVDEAVLRSLDVALRLLDAVHGVLYETLAEHHAKEILEALAHVDVLVVVRHGESLRGNGIGSLRLLGLVDERKRLLDVRGDSAYASELAHRGKETALVGRHVAW